MNTTLYIIVCWAVFLTLLYSYMFYASNSTKSGANW